MGFTIRVDDKPVRLAGKLPLLPLRDVVVFPKMTLPLFVGRPASVGAIERAATTQKILFATAQLRPEVGEPRQSDLHLTGTLIRILQVFRLPDGTMRILVEGLTRARLTKVRSANGHSEVEVAPIQDVSPDDAESSTLLRRVQTAFTEYAELSHRVSEEVRVAAVASDDPLEAGYMMAAQVLLKVTARQEVLEAETAAARLEVLDRYLGTELEILRLERKVEFDSGGVRNKKRRNSEPLRSPIPDLGGDPPEGAAEIEELEAAIRAAKMPATVQARAVQELERLARMPLFSPEATVTRGYITWLTSIPWHKKSRDRRDLDAAETVLDNDHHGLERVKERILEHLAVVQLTRKVRGPVLCLVGPPGVGKTSLGQSIAKSLGRRFVRMSLGGVRDEAEIRGHRRTYIGSMPGRIIQALRKAGTMNPVILLDEIDKLGADYRGDPAAALLEVLDPEQNNTFSDHYIEVDYDLSNVLFVTTANNAAQIPYALRDRMELIELTGYLETEKTEIAKQYLFPRQRQATGLKVDDIRIEDEAVGRLIREYTREAGVRNLEREIGSICRKAARKKASGKLSGTLEVTGDELQVLLGPSRFSENRLDRAGRIGVANGLAWTEAGGEVLFVEVKPLPGRGELILTGKLGDTMQESARAALSFVRSRAESLGLDPEFHRSIDLHVHVPDGAVPKDGPSAGVTMALAFVSALTDRATRSTVACTGEITLRGKVLPVGGIVEKAVAAHRIGIRTLIVPEGNRKNLTEIPENVRDELKIIPVSTMDEVLKHGISRSRARVSKGKKSSELWAA